MVSVKLVVLLAAKMLVLIIENAGLADKSVQRETE